MILLSSFFKVIYIVLAIFAILALGGLSGRDRKEKRRKIKYTDVSITYLDSDDPKGNATFVTYVAGAPFYCESADMRSFVGFVRYDAGDEAPTVYRNDMHMMGHIPRERICEYEHWCADRRTMPCVGYVMIDNNNASITSGLKVIKPYNKQYVEHEMRQYVDWAVMTFGNGVQLVPNTYAPILDKKRTKL